MPDDIVNELGRIPLFAELGRDELRAVAALAQREHHPSGSLICRQGERGRRAYLVESGELGLLHIDPGGVEREVARLGPGSFFGETSLLLAERRDATVRATQDVTLLYLDKQDFDQLLEQRPGMLDALRLTPETERKRRAPRFDWQDEDEVVIFLLHKHNAVLVRDLIFPGLVLLALLIGYWYLEITSLTALILGGLLASIPLLYALYRVADHFNDKYILTTKRVMHSERIFLIRESRVGAPLFNIQNVQVMRQGVLAQLFDFGDVLIQTAGEPGGQVAFPQIPDPTGMQQAILEQVQRAEAGARAEERAAIRDALRRQFGGSAPAEASSEPEERSPQPSPERHLSPRLSAPLGILRYFIPPLRYEEGDMITWRKHWVVLVGPITLPTALIISITLVAAWMLGQGGGAVIPVLVAYGTALVFLVPWWLWVFDDWRNDVYQMTRTRIIDVEKLPFSLREERREAGLDMIQNVNLEIPSLLGRLLQYGSVTIETAGAGAFTFDYVKRPRQVQAEIFRRMEAFKERQRQREASRRRDELLDWFSLYDQMRRPQSPDTGPSSPQQET